MLKSQITIQNEKVHETSDDSQCIRVYMAQHGSQGPPSCHGSLVYSASSVFSTFSFQIKLPKIL